MMFELAQWVGSTPAEPLDAPDHLAPSDAADLPHPRDRDHPLLDRDDRPAALGPLVFAIAGRPRSPLPAALVGRAAGGHRHRHRADVWRATIVSRHRFRRQAVHDGGGDRDHLFSAVSAALEQWREPEECTRPGHRGGNAALLLWLGATFAGRGRWVAGLLGV